jgi:purine-cytosine permease-like protein
MKARRGNEARDPRKRRRTYLAALVLLLTFAAGIAVGIGLAKAFVEFVAILGTAIVIAAIVVVAYLTLTRRRRSAIERHKGV